MRWTMIVLLGACSADLEAVPDAPPVSVRDRLATEAFLAVAAGGSAGGVGAEKRTSDGWVSADIVLAVDHGTIAVRGSPAGDVRLDTFEVHFAPVALPPSVLGQPAALSGLGVTLGSPVEAPAFWTDDDHGALGLYVDLDLAWTLELGGESLPLGSPHLAQIPVSIQLTGDGAAVSAAVALSAPGELWSWLNVVKLEDLELTVLATEEVVVD